MAGIISQYVPRGFIQNNGFAWTARKYEHVSLLVDLLEYIEPQ